MRVPGQGRTDAGSRRRQSRRTPDRRESPQQEVHRRTPWLERGGRARRVLRRPAQMPREMQVARGGLRPGRWPIANGGAEKHACTDSSAAGRQRQLNPGRRGKQARGSELRQQSELHHRPGQVGLLANGQRPPPIEPGKTSDRRFPIRQTSCDATPGRSAASQHQPPYLAHLRRAGTLLLSCRSSC